MGSARTRTFQCEHIHLFCDHGDLGEGRAHLILSVLRGHDLDEAMTGYCSRVGAFLGTPAQSTRLLVRLERVDPRTSRGRLLID